MKTCSPSVSLQRETWAEFYRDASALFPLHWRELALNQEHIKIDVDAERYEAMEKAGMLYLLTARADEELAGYIMAFLMPHFHYKSAGTMAIADMYWVKPEFRHGTGLRLFREWERQMREMGVVQMISSYKVHQDHGRFFELLGWSWTDCTVIKLLCP